MKTHATHEMITGGCLSCGLELGAFALVEPCANSRCPRCRDLAGCCRCQDTGPRVGEEFVFMSESDGAWREWTETIADVLGRISDGSWRVEVGHARSARVPDVLRERYGPRFGAARIDMHHVVFFDGRWWHVDAASDERVRRIISTEVC